MDSVTSRLEYLPVSFFASVMGTAGLALAWKKAAVLVGAPPLVGVALQWWALALFAAIAAAYAVKLVRHPAAVRAELAHPVRCNFFPTFSISLLLLGAAFAGEAPFLARSLWLAGAAAQLALTLTIIGGWLHHTHYEIKHANPAWFIPVVGNVVVPLGGVGFAPSDVSWFFFSIGVVFWPVLLTIVLYRLFFHEPLPARLAPTLFILIAPPAVALVSYVRLTGSVDAFARVLFGAALFFTLLLASNALRFLRLPFFLSAWAYSFPLAAMTIASFIMWERGGIFLGQWLSLGLLALLSLVVGALTLRTLLGIGRGEICQPE